MSCVFLGFALHFASSSRMDAADFCSLTEYKRNYPIYGPVGGPLRDAFNAFRSNVERVHNLADLPQLIGGSSTIARNIECVALADLHRSAEFPLLAGLKDQRLNPDSPEFDESILAEKEAIRLGYLNQFLGKMKEGKTTPFSIFKQEALSLLLEAENPKLVSGLNAILQAVVIEMWTSFEVLTEMVWEGAALLNPSIVTKTHKKTGFRSLDAIRSTYQLSFSPSPEIMKILDDPRLLSLSSIRNLIVHKSGVVDGKFQKRQAALAGVPNFAPFVAVPLDQRIELGGASVRDLKNPAIDLGFDLVSEVDLWLEANQ